MAAGQRPDVLGLQRDAADALQLGVEEVFQDLMPEELTLEQIPRRFSVHDRVLDLAGTLLRSEDRQVEATLSSVFDVTLLEQESREVELSDALTSILRQRDAFRGFVGEARDVLENGRQAVFSGSQPVARRVLHTLEGTFGCCALSELSAPVHELEADEALNRGSIAAVEGCLLSFLKAHEDVLQLDLDDRRDSRECVVSRSELDRLDSAARRGDSAGILAWVRWAREVPLVS